MRESCSSPNSFKLDIKKTWGKGDIIVVGVKVDSLAKTVLCKGDVVVLFSAIDLRLQGRIDTCSAKPCARDDRLFSTCCCSGGDRSWRTLHVH